LTGSENQIKLCTLPTWHRQLPTAILRSSQARPLLYVFELVNTGQGVGRHQDGCSEDGVERCCAWAGWV